MSDKITIKLERHLAHALCRGGELAAGVYRRSAQNQDNAVSARAMALATADEIDEAMSVIQDAITKKDLNPKTNRAKVYGKGGN